MKGILSNLGCEGQSHQGFKAFSPVQMVAFIGLIIFNILIPKMKFEHDFKTQQENYVVANDLSDRIVGDKKSRCWKEFKS